MAWVVQRAISLKLNLKKRGIVEHPNVERKALQSSSLCGRKTENNAAAVWDPTTHHTMNINSHLAMFVNPHTL